MRLRMLYYTFAFMLLVWGCSPQTKAQTTSEPSAVPNKDTDNQYWSELDFYYPLKNKGWIYGILPFTEMGHGATDHIDTEGSIGGTYFLNRFTNLDYLGKYVDYHYSPQAQFHEWRHDYAVTFHKQFGPVVVSDRNRGQSRDIDGKWSARYTQRLETDYVLPYLRNRVHLTEEQRGLLVSSLTPYISYEVFFDDRTNSWNKERFFFGTRFPVDKHISFDLYFMRESDPGGTPRHVDAGTSVVRYVF